MREVYRLESSPTLTTDNSEQTQQSRRLVSVPPDQFLSEVIDRARVIALVGAGGKTSLMYALADFACRQGRRVLVTTTTHIMCPRPEENLYCPSIEACEKNWAQGRYAVWGRKTTTGDGKLTALSKAGFEYAFENETINTILIEADGARRLSCKAPATHEPQIPDKAELVIGVTGLSVLGRTLKESCFRPELVAVILNRGFNLDHCLTPEDIAELLSSDSGTRKNVGDRSYLAILNQCDNLQRRELGEIILRRLAEQNISGALTCFLN